MGEAMGYTLPAFPGGLNLIDSIDAVPETDCVELFNLWPEGSRLVLRKGIEEFSEPSAGDLVKTLSNLILATGVNKLVSVCDHVFNLETAGTSTDITGTTTPTNDEWQHELFNHRLFFVNGADTPQVYTGTGDVADTTFTGVTQSTLINVSSHKERLYFVQKDTASVWYTQNVKVVSGALVEFPFAYQFKRGGFLVCCGSWTKATGSLSQDLFFALSSQGELLFYQGAYPGDTSWGIVARFFIGKPAGYRAFCHVENDLWFITSRGIVPVSILFGGTASVAANSLSRKVNKLVSDATREIPFSYLYSMKYSELQNMVFVNLPSTTTNTRQLVINTETGAWTVYRYAIPGAALSMEISNDEPYFGGFNGKVYKGETGYNDDEVAISFLARGGFSFFGQRGLFKKFIDIRPIMKVDTAALTLYMDMDTDFRQENDYATITTPENSPLELSEWDVAEWDVGPWSQEERYLFDRYSLARQGHCGALRIKGDILDALLEFNAFEIRFEEGSQV